MVCYWVPDWGSESLAGGPSGKSQDCLVCCSEIILLCTGFFYQLFFLSCLPKKNVAILILSRMLKKVQNMILNQE